MTVASERESSVQATGYIKGLFHRISPARRQMGRLARLLVYATIFWTIAAGVSALGSDHERSFQFWSCDDLKYERTVVHGVVEIHGDLVCPEKRIIQVSRVKGEVVFVSSSVMHTNGVQFEVPRQTSMSFGAPALIFEREQGSDEEIFTVEGELNFFADAWFPAPSEGTPEDLYSMVRVFDDGRYRARGVAHYTDSGITVGKDPTDHGYILRESHWAVRPDSTGTPSQPPSPFEPSKTPQTFLRRLIMSPMFLTAGEELHWPSSMTSEEGTMLTLGFDGSLLVRMPTGTASCPGGRGVRNQSEDGRFVLVTLVDADFEKFMRAQESSKKRSKKKGVVYEMKAVLRFTETGGVEITVDGTKVLSEANPTRKRWLIYNPFGRGDTRSSSYELHVVPDGFEVRLEGDVVWGKHADSRLCEASREHL